MACPTNQQTNQPICTCKGKHSPLQGIVNNKVFLTKQEVVTTYNRAFLTPLFALIKNLT